MKGRATKPLLLLRPSHCSFSAKTLSFLQPSHCSSSTKPPFHLTEAPQLPNLQLGTPRGVAAQGCAIKGRSRKLIAPESSPRCRGHAHTHTQKRAGRFTRMAPEGARLAEAGVEAATLCKSLAGGAAGSEWADRERSDVLVLFDVDGTLSLSRKTASKEMLQLLRDLKKKVVIGYVGGSDLAKQMEQLGEDAAKLLFDFGFSENGATAFRKGQLIGQESFIGYLGEERYKRLVNWTLRYLADIDVPVKRGTFIEFRNGMINVSPIGRSCSYPERLDFARVDEESQIRSRMVEAYKKEFSDFGLQFSIGGQISIDIFPQGWDKTYCLRHIANESFKEIHFFGDKTAPGGNDYELYHHPSVKGHTVTSPEDTANQVRRLFNL